MFRTVTFLTLVSQLQFSISNFHACVPNTQFFLNGLICSCDAAGRWTEANCQLVGRRQNCQPGKVMWQGCSRCICQENGQFLCNLVSCPNNHASDPVATTTKRNGLSSIGPWCTPFKIYYVNCSICVCPASGQTNNVHCVRDNTCTTAFKTPSTVNLLLSLNKNLCLPKVMYVFTCLQCMCSDEGYFVLNKCVETCHSNIKQVNLQRCTPKTFYKKDCNVCFCPENMIPDDKLCTREVCNGTNKYTVLHTLRTELLNCAPNQFTSPRCWYCECNMNGTINRKACLELYCLKFNYAELSEAQGACKLREMVPICTECFCFRNGTTHNDYCTNGCSYKSKLSILEKVFNNSHNKQLYDIDVLKNSTIKKSCKPNSIYVDDGKFCLCSDNGNTLANKSCVAAGQKNFNFEDPASEIAFKEIKVFIDYNTTCEPSTFVQFDCNTCFCNKNGTIDPKWCTYDDCAAKQAVQMAQKKGFVARIESSNDKCSPGSVYNIGCNFCICPQSGQNKDSACTNNRCSGDQPIVVPDNFDCEPLAYFEVDCNICFCPRDGKKNVDRCTKNVCEKNFLRSEACTPGTLFSDECNVCVCPPNGNKSEKACTKHKCHNSAVAWKSIYKFSHNIIGNQISEGTTRKLDLCFPGEEFMIGCHLCVCPEMGLKSYATCSDMLCEETKNDLTKNVEIELTDLQPVVPYLEVNQTFELIGDVSGRKQQVMDGCFIYNVSDSAERQECTPGSMYIIRCRQCICPYFGNINNFCREMDPSDYCEQAYPNINYLAMGRRTGNVTDTKPSLKKSNPGANQRKASGPHVHTNYKCHRPGRVMDKCFICECEEDHMIIKEHCFHNDSPECRDKKPTFLKDAH